MDGASPSQQHMATGMARCAAFGASNICRGNVGHKLWQQQGEGSKQVSPLDHVPMDGASPSQQHMAMGMARCVVFGASKIRRGNVGHKLWQPQGEGSKQVLPLDHVPMDGASPSQ